MSLHLNNDIQNLLGQSSTLSGKLKPIYHSSNPNGSNAGSGYETNTGFKSALFAVFQYVTKLQVKFANTAIDEMTDLAIIKELSVAGKHQECLQACQNVLQTNPDEVDAYKYAGKSLLALGQFEKSQQCLVKAHELDSSDPEIVKDIGNIFLNIGNKDTALEWYEKAIGMNNYYAPAINNIASLKRQSGNIQEAIDLFQRAIHADPKLIQAYIGVATSFLVLGNLDQAESFARKALAINEKIPGVNEICGKVYQSKNKHDKAIEYYQRELHNNPQASNSLMNLGLLLLQKGQTVAALKALTKASDLAPSKQCSLLLVQVYQHIGRFKEAIVEYKKLNINQSSDKLIPFNLGLCSLETGDNNAAIEAFKIAIQLDETFIAAWGNLSNALRGEGRLKEAMEPMLKVLDLDPGNPDANMNLGQIYKDLGQLDHALAATLKSLELKPDNPTAQMNLGQIYKDLGQLDHALAATLKSLELKPDNPDALMNMGGIYSDLGDLNQALGSTLKSLEIKPDNPDAIINLSEIYKDLLDYKNTELSVDLAIKLNGSKSDICQRLKAACLFQRQKYDEAIELLKLLKSEIMYTEESTWKTDIALRSAIQTRKRKIQELKEFSPHADLKNKKFNKSLILTRHRDVSEDLIKELYNINTKELRHTRDARDGPGYCTNFHLFDNESPEIKRLSRDLKAIASASLSMNIMSLKYDSFFNIFNSGARTSPHSHITNEDKDFNLGDHKYSLVYYLDPGDQNGEHPGILKIHNPELEILPSKGMIIIMPSTTVHSSYYEGAKSRLMIGVNFYAFSGDLG